MGVFSHRLFAFLLLAALLPVAREGAAQARTARTVRVPSQALGGETTVAVLLPVDYDESALRYPVLYLLHGGTQNHTAFPARPWFVRDASERRMIVVMPSLQPAFFASRGDSPAPVEEFLAHELPAYIDARYRSLTDRRARAIAGISLGGYGATLLGVKQPDVFGAVGAISAALATGSRPRDVGRYVAVLSPDAAPFFYIACGADDAVVTASRQLAAQLRERQIRAELREVPGDHSWRVWDPQVRAFFDVLAKLPGWSAIAN
jgi:S-formylglutathione hydrolase FrmB